MLTLSQTLSLPQSLPLSLPLTQPLTCLLRRHALEIARAIDEDVTVELQSDLLGLDVV